jgi:hypothetical protein
MAFLQSFATLLRFAAYTILEHARLEIARLIFSGHNNNQLSSHLRPSLPNALPYPKNTLPEGRVG